MLDTAAPEFSSPVAGGAKLVAIDLGIDKVVKTVVFPENVIDANTYVNDVRFDFRVRREGVAYVTDSSPSGKGADAVEASGAKHEAVQRILITNDHVQSATGLAGTAFGQRTGIR